MVFASSLAQGIGGCRNKVAGAGMVNFEVVVSLIEVMGLLALLSIGFGSIERAGMRPLLRSCLCGLLFGSGALVAMTSPTQIADGIIVDGRSIIIGLGAAFGGLPAAIISAVVAVSYRLWLGGAGAIAGAVGIAVAALAGLAWSRHLRPSGRLGTRHLALLGGLISCNVLSAFCLPFDTAVVILTRAGWMLVAGAILGSIVLGKFIDRELALITREKQWEFKAMTDSLTRLPNRRYFERALRHEVSAVAEGGADAVLLIADIDHFKKVNDTFGHAAGDEALRELARLLRTSVGPRDIVARVGGEEFGILLPETSPATAHEIASRIRRSVEGLLVTAGDDTFGFTISIGGTPLVASGTAELAQRRADAALYAAKRAGRNRVEIAGLGEAGTSPGGLLRAA